MNSDGPKGSSEPHVRSFRFSLSGLLVFVLVVATVLSLGGGVTSPSSLRAIWLAAFLLSYWNSPAAGWRQIVRAVAITGCIWSISVLWAYTLFANVAGMPAAFSLAARGSLVALMGIVFALGTAFFVEGVRWTWHLWRRSEVRRRVLAVLVLLLSITLGCGVWTVTRVRYWEPAFVATSESAGGEFACLDQIKQRRDVEYAQFVVCADGRFVAARLNGQREVLVFDAATAERVARLGAGDDRWFGPLAFRPDHSALAAILYSKSSGPRLAQWNTAAWKPRDPILIDSLVVRSNPGGCRSYSLDDRFLLIVDFRDVLKEKAKADIFTVDLLKEQLTPRCFASATIELNKLAAWKYGNLAPETIPWIVAPNGNWIATSGRGGDYLFWTKSSPARLRGRAIGFLRDGDHVVVWEKSARLVWKAEWRETLDPRPPFWDHLRLRPLSRVVILNCRSQKTVAQSRWMQQMSRPHMTPNRSRLTVEHTRLWRRVSKGPQWPHRQKSVLVWEMPELTSTEHAHVGQEGGV